MWIAPWKDNTWQWGKATQFMNNGNVVFNGSLGIGTSAPPAAKLDVLAGQEVMAYSLSGFPFLKYSSGDVLDYGAFGNTWQALRFLTNGSERMRIASNGNIGIGTNSPTSKLDVNGNINLAGAADRRIFMGGAGGSTFGLAYDSTYPNYGIFYTEGEHDFVSISPNGNSQNGVMNIFGNGNVGIGTNSPSEKLHINGNIKINPVDAAWAEGLSFSMPSTGKWGGLRWRRERSGFDGNWYIGYTALDSSDDLVFGSNNNGEQLNNILRLTKIGNVGIGTTNPTSKLTVAGNINSREVKVSVDAGADFVFEKDYALPSLQEVEKFVTENKHLPEIASAKEMQKDGINLSEMNIKLLQKIEELTLYLIEQEKKNIIQSKEIEKLREEKESYKIIFDRLTEIEKKLR